MFGKTKNVDIHCGIGHYGSVLPFCSQDERKILFSRVLRLTFIN